LIQVVGQKTLSILELCVVPVRSAGGSAGGRARLLAILGFAAYKQLELFWVWLVTGHSE